MTQQITATKPNSTPSALGPAFLVIVVVLLLAHLTGHFDGIYDQIHINPHFRDVSMFGLIAILALFAIQFGATAYSILPTATFAGFAVLSIHQPEPLLRYLILGAVLFAIGMYGMLVSRNAVRVLMSIELMLNAANINLVAFSRYVDSHAIGQVFAIFVLTVAAAEAAVGLGIVLAIYRNVATVDMERFNILKW
jgi:NAD(P)H-quinone oxidoreductase subunit 4L